MDQLKKAGFGGGCHWCTEAVFQFLKGVKNVEQGFISSTGEAATFSEAVIVEYDPEVVPLEVLIEIHLHTHRSTSSHSFRKKYRSAIYFFDPETAATSKKALEQLQKEFNEKIITEVIPFREFKASDEMFTNYYLSDPEKPFCRSYIHPKLNFLRENYTKEVLEPSKEFQTKNN